MRGMGGMVGRDAVDAAVEQTLHERLTVGGSAQRRIHLEVRVIGLIEGRLVEEEMVRRGLAGHRQPLGLRGAHHVETAGGGQMLDVQRAAGQPAECDIAGYLELLALGRP